MPTYSLVGKSRLKEVKTLFISPMKSGCPVLHRWKGVAPLLLSHPYLDISPDAMPEEPSLMFFAFSVCHLHGPFRTHNYFTYWFR